MVKKWTIYRKINVLAVIASLISLFLPLYTNKGAVSSFISIFTFLSDHIPKLYKFSTSNPGAFEFLSISAIALIFFSVCSVLNLFCTLVIKRYHIRKPVCIALSICTSISSIIIIIFSLMADSTQYSLYYTVPVMLFFSITTFICSVLEPSAFIPANEYPSKKIYDNHQNTLIDSDFSITCLSGEYSGGKFPIDNGNKLNIGRDPAKCHCLLKTTDVADETGR